MNIQTLLISALALTPSELYQSTKAKKAHVKAYPECAMCGSRKNLEVHHIVPVQINPKLAAVRTNLITLCDGPNGSNSACHRYFGHFGNFRSDYNVYIREQCYINRMCIERLANKRYLFTAEEMMHKFAHDLGISTECFLNRVNDAFNYQFHHLTHL